MLEIVRHSFRLVSPNNKCVLTSTTKNLPEWGFGSAEVACNPKIHDDRAYWHIDDNRYPRRNETHFQLLRTQKLLIFIVCVHLLCLVPNVSYTIYELSFLERFIESHKNMFMGNAGFRPKISDFQSRPWMWPINFRVCKNQERFRFIQCTTKLLFLSTGSILFSGGSSHLPAGQSNHLVGTLSLFPILLSPLDRKCRHREASSQYLRQATE